MTEVSLLQLMPQPLRERNLGIRRELRRRLGANGRIGHCDLEHGMSCDAYRMPSQRIFAKTKTCVHNAAVRCRKSRKRCA